MSWYKIGLLSFVLYMAHQITWKGCALELPMCLFCNLLVQQTDWL